MNRVNEAKNLGDAVVDRETEQCVNGAVETYLMPEHGWTCFHCGETFTTVGSAADHFGATPERRAGCLIDRVVVETGTDTERGRGLLMELRKVEASRDEWMDEALRGRNEIEALECQIESLTTAMQSYKPFRECHSIRDVFFVYDSMEGRAIAAEESVSIQEQCECGHVKGVHLADSVNALRCLECTCTNFGNGGSNHQEQSE